MVPAVGSSSEKNTANASNPGGWLVNVADDVVLPMTTLEVIDGLRAERLSDKSLVWRIGMHDWTPISDVPQLRLAAGSRFPPPVQPRVTEAPASVLPVPAPAIMPSSLAPTIAETETDQPSRAAEGWAEFDELLENERRADLRNSRRVVLGAALGAAALAGVFALWLLRSPAAHESSPPQGGPAQASDAPVLAPTIEAIAPSAATITPPASAAPLASVTTPASATPPSAAVPIPPRAKRAATAASANEAAVAASGVAVVPVAPLDPAPAVSTAPEAPAPPPVPDSP